MMRVRIGLVAVLAALAAGGTVAATAVAAPNGAGSANGSSFAPLYKHSINGATKSGKKFTGTYGIQRFVVATVHGKRGVYAVGTLTGTFKGQHISRNNVMMPAKLTGGSSSSSSSSSRDTTRQAASCTILHLVLGPINLNLLGLNVALGGGNITPGNPATQPITINLTGTPGGGLLGSLLCGLDNALGSGSTLADAEQQPAAAGGDADQPHLAPRRPLEGRADTGRPAGMPGATGPRDAARGARSP